MEICDLSHLVEEYSEAINLLFTGIANCAIWQVMNKYFDEALGRCPNIGYTESTLYWRREQVIDRLLSLVFHFH